jgi:hypothetical protein
MILSANRNYNSEHGENDRRKNIQTLARKIAEYLELCTSTVDAIDYNYSNHGESVANNIILWQKKLPIFFWASPAAYRKNNARSWR